MLKSCKCAGSVAYVHCECLKNWLKMKQQTKKGTQFISMFWKTFECEICKSPYPYQFKHLGRKYSLVELESPPTNTPFMILESLNMDKNSSRMIHMFFINTEKTQFRLVSKRRKLSF